MRMWPQRPDVASDSLEAAQKCRAEQGLDARPAFPPGPRLPHGDLLTQRGWGGGPRGKPLLPNTPICTPSISGFLRPPARQPAIAPTSPHLLTLRPPPPGWLFSRTHSSSALLCSEELRSSSQSPFCLGEAGKGEEGAGAGRRSQQISPCVALDKSGISLRADRGLDDGLDVLEQGEDADKWGKTERGQ